MTDFERYRPAIAVYFAGTLAMAVIFGAVVLWGGSPVRPEFYGPVVYAVPALFWATIQASFSAAAMVGCSFGWPVLTAIGGIGLALLFMFFATAAIAAGASGTLLVGMAIPAGAVAGLCAYIAWRGRHGAEG